MLTHALLPVERRKMWYLDTEGPTGLQGGGVWRDIPEQYAAEARKILGTHSGDSLVGKIAALIEEIALLKK